MMNKREEKKKHSERIFFIIRFEFHIVAEAKTENEKKTLIQFNEFENGNRMNKKKNSSSSIFRFSFSFERSVPAHLLYLDDPTLYICLLLPAFFSSFLFCRSPERVFILFVADVNDVTHTECVICFYWKCLVSNGVLLLMLLLLLLLHISTYFGSHLVIIWRIHSK